MLFSAKLPRTFLNNSVEEIFFCPQSIYIGFHLFRMVFLRKGSLTYLLQSVLGARRRPVMVFIGSFRIHQQHIGITHIRIVNSRTLIGCAAQRRFHKQTVPLAAANIKLGKRLLNNRTHPRIFITEHFAGNIPT